MMKYQVKVPNVSRFVQEMRFRYRSLYGNLTVKALTSKKGVVNIIQKGDGLNPVDLIDTVLDITGGEYLNGK